jgi:hypothetical protein
MIYAVHIIISYVFNILHDKKNDKTFSLVFFVFNCILNREEEKKESTNVLNVYFDPWMNKIKYTCSVLSGNYEASITDNIPQLEQWK